MKQRNGLPVWVLLSGVISLLLAASIAQCQQETAPTAANDTAALTSAVRDLQQQVSELRSAVAEVRSEAALYRQQTEELRHELDAERQGPATAQNMPTPTADAPSAGSTTSSLAQKVSSLEETTSLLNDKINEQSQTRVESASKYHVRLSGLVLMNLFDNHGATDNSDIPSFATLPTASEGTSNFGGTVRQSEIGLEVFGPEIAGAKVSGNLTADFAGGFPNTWNGVDSGIFRMQVANVRMDWKNTSIVAGQDGLFISPGSPTSFASLAIPAFNYAGNLWAWTPQVRIEHSIHLSDDQEFKVQAGILDNLTGEFPASSFERSPQAGESSGQPAYAGRAEWKKDIFGLPMTLGTAAYYSRQDWQFGRIINGWAGLTDWDIPLARLLSLSGEFYSGNAVAGINGGIGRSVLFDGNPTLNTTTISGLRSRGGWSQLKLKANSRLEFNGAFGLDNPDASEARQFTGGTIYVGPTMVKNVSEMGNFIYRPRSNVILSTEYKHLATADVLGDHYAANQLNMIMGILF